MAGASAVGAASAAGAAAGVAAAGADPPTLYFTNILTTFQLAAGVSFANAVTLVAELNIRRNYSNFQTFKTDYQGHQHRKFQLFVCRSFRTDYVEMIYAANSVALVDLES